LLLAIGGGKGGVGKSVIAANLAVALAKLGARVTAVDADLGSANLHTLFGIDQPGLSLQALLDGRVTSLQEVVIPSGQPRVDLVPGSIAIPGAANLQHARKQKLLRHLRGLDAEIVVVDCGAGIHFNVLDFFNAADACLVIANAQLVSLQNAYGFVKAAIYRKLRQRASDEHKAELMERASDGSETETVPQLLGRLARADASLAAELAAELETVNIALLGNQLSDLRELGAIQALSRMGRDFLGVKCEVLGGLRRLDRIHHSVTRRVPFVSELGTELESQLLAELAEHYLSINVLELRQRRAESASRAARDASCEIATGDTAEHAARPMLTPQQRQRRAQARQETESGVIAKVSTKSVAPGRKSIRPPSSLRPASARRTAG
jgi:flagellar biosynthesis protein FlhG